MANDLRQGIIETARALGMDPVDLATIISYETGGTFNPTQGGPTTRWGKHRGLIQFGEPQAKQYGVDWNDPAGSQLGPNGAIVKYFQASGWKPGMGLLDAYSIVNAGGPGKYDASDVAAGGDASAPTVRAKVDKMVGGHRNKAVALLGGDYAADRGNYDPRLDTPSSGRPVGSDLPGPYAPVGAGDSPSESGGRFGGSTSSTSPYSLPEREPKTWKDRLKGAGDAMGDALANMGGMGAWKQPDLPAQPGAALASAPVAPGAAAVGATNATTAAELQRQKLALVLQKLNQGTLV